MRMSNGDDSRNPKRARSNEDDEDGRAAKAKLQEVGAKEDDKGIAYTTLGYNGHPFPLSRQAAISRQQLQPLPSSAAFNLNAGQGNMMLQPWNQFSSTGSISQQSLAHAAVLAAGGPTGGELLMPTGQEIALLQALQQSRVGGIPPSMALLSSHFPVAPGGNHGLFGSDLQQQRLMLALGNQGQSASMLSRLGLFSPSASSHQEALLQDPSSVSAAHPSSNPTLALAFSSGQQRRQSGIDPPTSPFDEDADIDDDTVVLPHILYSKCDKVNVSPYQRMVRQQIEVFAATLTDTDCSTQGRNRPIAVGQVGIRCIHCKHLHPRQRSRGNAYYPGLLTGIYQAAQNMAQSHLSRVCTHVPKHVRARLVKLQVDKASPFGGGKQYWAERVVAWGVVEEDDILKCKREAPPVSSPEK